MFWRQQTGQSSTALRFVSGDWAPVIAAARSALQAAEPGMAAYREPRYTDQDDDVFQVDL